MNRKDGAATITLRLPMVLDVETERMLYFIYGSNVMLDFHGQIGHPVVRVKESPLLHEGDELWIPMDNVSSIVWNVDSDEEDFEEEDNFEVDKCILGYKEKKYCRSDCSCSSCNDAKWCNLCSQYKCV